MQKAPNCVQVIRGRSGYTGCRYALWSCNVISECGAHTCKIQTKFCVLTLSPHSTLNTCLPIQDTELCTCDTECQGYAQVPRTLMKSLKGCCRCGGGVSSSESAEAAPGPGDALRQSNAGPRASPAGPAHPRPHQAGAPTTTGGQLYSDPRLAPPPWAGTPQRGRERGSVSWADQEAFGPESRSLASYECGGQDRG